MRLWKILVCVPYLLIALWLAAWILPAVTKTVTGAAVLPYIILMPVMVVYGIIAAALYTGALAIVLLVRHFRKRASRIARG